MARHGCLRRTFLRPVGLPSLLTAAIGLSITFGIPEVVGQNPGNPALFPAASVFATQDASPPSSEAKSSQPQPSEGLSLEWKSGLAVVLPQAKMQWTCSGNLSAQDVSKTLELRYSVIRVSDGQKVTSGKRAAPVVDGRVSIAIDQVAPSSAGVYELRCRLVNLGDGVWGRIRADETTLMGCSEPLLVISTTQSMMAERAERKFSATRLLRPGGISALSKNNDSISVPWQTIGVIRPSDPSWRLGQWLPSSATRVMPGLRRVMGDLKQLSYGGEKVSLIEPKSVFQARLPVGTLGHPHRIIVRVPANRAQKLRIDVGGEKDPFNARVSVELPSPLDHDWSTHDEIDRSKLWGHQSKRETVSVSTDDDPRWVSKTFLYFPRGDDQIWLTNLSDRRPVAFESIEVMAGPAWIVSPDSSVDDWDELPAKRQFAINLQDPRWIETLSRGWSNRGDDRSYQPETHRWQQARLAVERVTQWAHCHGACAVSIPWKPTESSSSDSFDFLLKLFELNRVRVFLVVDIADIAETDNEWLTGHLVRSGETTTYTDSKAFEGVIFRVPGTVSPNKPWLRQLSGYSDALANIPWFVECGEHRLDASSIQQIDSMGGRLIVAVPERPQHGAAVNFDDGEKNASSTSVHLVGTNESFDTAMVPEERSQRLMDVLSKSSPDWVWLDLNVHGLVIDEALQQITESVARMPSSDWTTILASDPNEQTAVIEYASGNDKSMLRVTNLAPWDTRISFSSSSKTPWDDEQWQELPLPKAFDSPISKTDVVKESDENSSQGWLVPARSTRLLRASDQLQAKIQPAQTAQWRWTASVEGGEDAVTDIKQRVTAVVERIGILGNPPSLDRLRNGGFELNGDVGMLGWMHTQHPPGCVSIDSSEAIEGKHCVRLTTDTSATKKTWLVSETIVPPRSGRLAVSMACRAQASEKNSEHHLKVSIEGTRNKTPFRKSKEIVIPLTGQWQPKAIVLEVDLVGVESTDTLRLTIDSQSSGSVWIDDVSLHDNFPMSQERSELQSQAFLAVQGLQRGSFTPSAKLLLNHWARVLLTTKPVVSLSSGKESSFHEPRQNKLQRTSASEETPGVAERFREWLPSPLRF